MATKTTAKKTTKSTTTKASASAKGKILVIVESPAKSKTIKKILGDEYVIEASYGHVRDLAKKGMGFDVEKDFEPTFVVIPEKKNVVDTLNKAAKNAKLIYLASDPDREGEAIAWHVKEILKVPEEKIQRIVFNEITPKAVQHAVETPHEIDLNLVHAQQTRQILDKLVGFKISPVLWEKMKNYKLSAGRVQSVALKMIVEREELIDAFVPTEYWSISADCIKDKIPFSAELAKYKGKKIDISSQEAADKIIKELSGKDVTFEVSNIAERMTTRKPTAPFITSTLQREASSKLGYGVSKTMQIAQKLYEGMEIDGEPVGLITYMRTDSVRVSDDAQAAAKDYILNNFGEKYYPQTPNNYVKAGKKNVQDAHEAIRPSYIDKTPQSIKKYLTPEQYKLYKLIWDRFMSSQMSNASINNKTVEIDAADYQFRVGTSKVVFDGFLALYQETPDESAQEEDSIDNKMPDFKKGDKVTLKKLNPKQHFTQPPPRYSEASLVKALEEYGIGRPSTYASIITKIQTRNYVEKIDKALAPTFLGKTVCAQLNQHFQDIMDYQFTAGMETKLDKIAENKEKWVKVLKDFYAPFISTVDAAKANMEIVRIESDVTCPNCGRKMLVKTSRWGSQFLGCEGYPECKTMMSLDGETKAPIEDEKSDEKCEKCGAEMLIKRGPYGKYLQCTNEQCKNRKKIVQSTGVKCQEKGCDGEYLVRKSRFGKLFYGCSNYPNCKSVLWNEPIDEKCPDCGSILVKKVQKKMPKIACSNKDCKYIRDAEVETND